MQINCKTPGCTGTVEYFPQEVELGLFEERLKADKKSMAEPLAHEYFSKAVSGIVKSPRNVFNRTKTAYLTCDFVGTGGPHTNAYQVPAK
ncbi:MAG: hypothetical protein JST32_13420 [Bacteroidetes bacterium]|nr:hypothetical protein [Bacteroidota bacterium]